MATNIITKLDDLIAMNKNLKIICPYCKRAMKAEDKLLDNNPFAPFCSERCKFADLDKWFNGEYFISQSLDELTEEQLDDLPKHGD